jgi:hypothetical protein
MSFEFGIPFITLS